MPKMTGARLFAEMMHGYEVSHIFFVPAFMLKAFAEMEDMPIARIMVHGERRPRTWRTAMRARAASRAFAWRR